MPETTPLIKAALNLRGGAGFDVYATTGLAPVRLVPCSAHRKKAPKENLGSLKFSVILLITQ